LYGDSDESYLLGPEGARVIFNLQPGRCADFAEANCGSSEQCNTMNSNRTVDAANHPTAGSVIRLQDGTEFDANQIGLRNNSAQHALDSVDGFVDLQDCLIADNAFSAETLRFEADGGFGGSEMDNCTIVNNTHNSGSVIRTAHDFTLTRSIIDQPVMSTLSTEGSPSITAQDILAADPTGLAAGPNIVPGRPTYVNAAAHDYHLRAVLQNGTVSASLGIDFATPRPGNGDFDLDGNLRTIDLPAVPNFEGAMDLGCYEVQQVARSASE
jgi:hypothetical protein